MKVEIRYWSRRTAGWLRFALCGSADEARTMVREHRKAGLTGDRFQVVISLEENEAW